MARVKVPVQPSADQVEEKKPTVFTQHPSVSTNEVNQPTPNTVGQHASKRTLYIGVGLGVVILFFLISLVNDRNQLKQEVEKLSTSQGTQTQSNQKVVDDVAKLVDVPAGITPAVKTPSGSEIAQLSKDNSLYKSAKAGDAFLLYTEQDSSLFLVIYRPSESKVVLAAPANVGQQTTNSNNTQR